MLADEGGDRLLPGPTCVLPGVPLRRAHVPQERLHGHLVTEQRAIEVAGIPVDEHAAEIEDGCGRGGHRWLRTAVISEPGRLIRTQRVGGRRAISGTVPVALAMTV